MQLHSPHHRPSNLTDKCATLFRCRASVGQGCNMQDLWRCPRASVLRIHFLGFSKGWSPHALHGVLEGAATGYPRGRMHGRNRNKELGALMLDVDFARLHRTALGLTSLTRAYRLNPAHSFVLCCQTLTSLHYLEFVIPWHGCRPLKLQNSFCICS